MWRILKSCTEPIHVVWKHVDKDIFWDFNSLTHHLEIKILWPILVHCRFRATDRFLTNFDDSQAIWIAFASSICAWHLDLLSAVPWLWYLCYDMCWRSLRSLCGNVALYLFREPKCKNFIKYWQQTNRSMWIVIQRVRYVNIVGI